MSRPPTGYVNEYDPFAAAWCRRLIDAGHLPPAVVDERPIQEVTPDDLRAYTQCHFFGGVGGWPYALALAGWDATRPVWTGSCPCQPYSSAGKRQGDADERNLWPAFFGLIRECRPVVVFGEQVQSAIGHGWLDGVSADLEGEGYAVGSVVLGAHSVGAPHIRQRLFWVADSGGERVRADGRGADAGEAGEVQGEARQQRLRADAGNGGTTGRMAYLSGEGRVVGRPEEAGQRESDESQRLCVACGPRLGGVGDSDRGRQPKFAERDRVATPRLGPPLGADVVRSNSAGGWGDFDIVACRDGKSRRVEPGSFPLAHGVPARVGRLRGYGNAIVPQVAALFVRAFLDYQLGGIK